MKKQTDTFKRLRAEMKDVNGDHRQIIKTIQDQIKYLMVEVVRKIRTILLSSKSEKFFKNDT